jgi:3-phenylpropionate/trans-cinnamate dioxygenase ferredoxin subunit
MARYVVATTTEIPPGGRKIVEVAGRSIGIFNLDGEFVALRNRCPHQGGPLCEGGLSGLLEATVPGEYCYSRPGEMLRCPWHGWEFDLRTGQSWFDPERMRVRRYPVSVEAGRPSLAQGPYVAETYPVSLEAQYIVVEIGPVPTTQS